jgi:hypothetical protein
LGLPKERLGGELPYIGSFLKEKPLTQRVENVLILFLMTGFFLFLVFCSCKNENLIDPLDILDPHNPDMWPICNPACGASLASNRPELMPPPEQGEIYICTGPNPTSEPICIQYDLSGQTSEANVSIVIYTQKGEKVATLVRERQSPSPSPYAVEWNLEYDSGVPVANATYRAYFMAGGFVTHGDITVLR